ncbi:penicillin-binding protein 1C [Labrys wisconsinensis]|uniref:peptidoglycan glycosyltransferase n=1 Tax=Labrys wisconsinensis TaxID=425677 RepID=A0ABU0J947_9HYPH|nr:penicillin-binding protein 1C [Labrys wisconsinensis]MDQ0470796.1 penicillin-binding protein 1C [Labrys wisconsinensis]
MNARRFRIVCAALFSTIVVVNAIGFGVSELLRRLGPPPLGQAITYSPLVVDREGRLLRPFTTADGFWRLPATPGEVDKRFLAMLVAYEDKRFYRHPGVDARALLRAAWQALRHGRVVSGGSTLTMQVARLLEPRPERTLGAKLVEMVRAIQLERALSKDQILTLYLALAPYGGNLEGVRAASLAYFGKEPKRLSTAEAALLVSLPQAPEVRRPDRGAAVAAAARNRVLALLAARGAVGADQAETARLEPAPQGRKPFPMLAAHVAERLAKGDADGTVERTTLSRPLQEQLEALARGRAAALGGGVSVAILAVDNVSGEVRAHVGGVDYFDRSRAGQVDLAQAIRSPGSTLKPFIYGLAFEDGLAHPETLVDDRPARFGAYQPENFDESFRGTVTMRRALQQSLNVPAVMLLKAVGPTRLVARLHNAGVTAVLPPDAAPGLAVGLGGAGVRLTDLATLYLALARDGDSLPLVWRSQDRVAKDASTRRLLEAAAAWQVGDVLIGAPPPENALGGRIAYKTGTSYGYRDAWAVGFDGANTVAVWIGRPDGAAVPGLVGRVSAAPVLFDAFQRIGERRVPLAAPPRGVVFARTEELPVALQRFRPDGLPVTASSGPGDAPLSISFPPNGARVDIGASGPDAALALKAMGGAPPFTWLVDGTPIVTGEVRRQASWDAPSRGFARLSVIDARGRTASALIRVE